MAFSCAQVTAKFGSALPFPFSDFRLRAWPIFQRYRGIQSSLPIPPLYLSLTAIGQKAVMVFSVIRAASRASTRSARTVGVVSLFPTSESLGRLRWKSRGMVDRRVWASRAGRECHGRVLPGHGKQKDRTGIARDSGPKEAAVSKNESSSSRSRSGRPFPRSASCRPTRTSRLLPRKFPKADQTAYVSSLRCIPAGGRVCEY